jgi:predicted transcriptional regulator
VTAKQKLLDVIGAMPDDVSLDEIAYRLTVFVKVQRGLDDIEHGRVVPHEVVMAELDEIVERARG